MPLILYHLPRCSKSRAALQYLTEQGFMPEVVHYAEHAPDADTLLRLKAMLQLDDLRGMMRTEDALFGELGLNRPDTGQAELLAALQTHPLLLQRPIAVWQGRAAIGRPLERIAGLLAEPEEKAV